MENKRVRTPSFRRVEERIDFEAHVVSAASEEIGENGELRAAVE